MISKQQAVHRIDLPSPRDEKGTKTRNASLRSLNCLIEVLSYSNENLARGGNGNVFDFEVFLSFGSRNFDELPPLPSITERVICVITRHNMENVGARIETKHPRAESSP